MVRTTNPRAPLALPGDGLGWRGGEEFGLGFEDDFAGGLGGGGEGADGLRRGQGCG